MERETNLLVVITNEAREQIIQTIIDAINRLQGDGNCYIEFWMYRNGLRALHVYEGNHDFFLSFGNVESAVLKKKQFVKDTSVEEIRSIVNQSFSFLPPVL